MVFGGLGDVKVGVQQHVLGAQGFQTPEVAPNLVQSPLARHAVGIVRAGIGDLEANPRAERRDRSALALRNLPQTWQSPVSQPIDPDSDWVPAIS